MRYEQRRRVERCQDLRQLVDQLRIRLFVEPRERLIEQHQPGAKAEGSREADPPGLAARQAIGTSIEEMRHAEQRHGVLDAPPGLFPADAAKPQPEPEVVANGLTQEDDLLEGVGQIAGARDGRPAEMHSSFADGLEASEDAQQRGLAGAVGTENGGRAPLAELERRHVEDQPPAAEDPQTLDAQRHHERDRC